MRRTMQGKGQGVEEKYFCLDYCTYNIYNKCVKGTL